MKARLAFAAGAFACAAAAHGQTVLMSPEWAKGMCTAWNASPVLTVKLGESGWATNNKNRGYKVMQIRRADCPDSPRVELRVAWKEGKAICVYGGAAETKVDGDVDYVMWADTRRWVEMGAGEYGPMRAMMFGRLSFEGPKGEAMGNMDPFEEFLLLVGKVPGDTKACPARK